MIISDIAKQKIYDEFKLFEQKQYNGKSRLERKKLNQFFTPPDLSIKIIENLESTLNFERLKEFDAQKTKVFKYITYKKRTEQEVRKKFKGQIEDEMLEEIIEYLKEAKYLDDYDFIERQVREYMNLKTLSIKEIKYKLMTKGLDRKLIEQYIEKNYEELNEYEERCIERIKKKKSDSSEEEIRQYLYRKGYKI